MGRTLETEKIRRGGDLAIREPKRMISEKEKSTLASLPQPEENKPLANLNRLKEFNGLYNGCLRAIQNNKDGRKAERLRESSERIRLYLVDSLRKAGAPIAWQAEWPAIHSMWQTVRDQMWRGRDHLDVMQIQESVRTLTARLFELPGDGWAELEKALENLKNLKTIR
jgi:hypothetical protein